MTKNDDAFARRRAEAFAYAAQVRREVLRANLADRPARGELVLFPDEPDGGGLNAVTAYSAEELAALERGAARMKHIPAYFNPAGPEYWNGRGRAPLWFVDACEAGYSDQELSLREAV